MGRKSITGGVAPKGADRIELTFVFEGVRYRPTIKRAPSEANLRRARVQLQEIKRRIASGTFVFAEEFPEYRYMEQLGGDARGARTCNDVFNEFMTHCESRMSKSDLAFATIRELSQDSGLRLASGDRDCSLRQGQVFRPGQDCGWPETLEEDL